MNKLDVVAELIKLSKSSDYIMTTDWNGWKKYSYNSGKLDYMTVEFGMYRDTRCGWLKYYTKDVAKSYKMSPVEILLIDKLFSQGALR